MAKALSGSGTSLTRRKFLVGALAAGATVAFGRTRLAFALDASARSWSDPSAWGGVVPGPYDIAVVNGTVMLDRDVRVGGLIVPSGSAVVFDPARSVTLSSIGNVEVRGGGLVMRPSSARVVHTLRFVDVDESKFAGGGMTPLATDVGLWVTNGGKLDTVGKRKLAWTRARSVRQGARKITVRDVPEGWRPGDELVLTPTVPVTYPNHFEAYDTAHIVSVSGNVITLDRPLAHPHPAVDVGDKVFGCEVLNLTRNVVIGGMETGRAHINFVGTDQVPQVISNVRIEHVGPQNDQGLMRGTTPVPEPVLGRYGLHFHMCEDSTRGTVVSGVVVTDCGSHAFVPHMSHGITLRNCIAHDTTIEQYWWDRDTLEQLTNDTTFERCVASLARTIPAPKYMYRTGSFEFLRGEGNSVTNSVAVGNSGLDNSAGFMWRGQVDEGLWDFDNNVTHNNAGLGSFIWQNGTRRPHVLHRLVAYHNGGHGILHGAYRNGFAYEDAISFANGGFPLLVHAMGKDDPLQRFQRCRFDSAGLTDYAVAVTGSPKQPPLQPAVFHRCRFLGSKRASVGQLSGANDFPMQADFLNCSFGGNEFYLGPSHPETRWRVQDTAHGSIALTPGGNGGQWVAAWAAEKSRISPFEAAPSAAAAGGNASESVSLAMANDLFCEVPA